MELSSLAFPMKGHCKLKTSEMLDTLSIWVQADLKLLLQACLALLQFSASENLLHSDSAITTPGEASKHGPKCYLYQYTSYTFCNRLQDSKKMF